MGSRVLLEGEGGIASALLDDAVTSSKESGHSLSLINALGWCAVVHVANGESGCAHKLPDDTDVLLRQTGLTKYSGMSVTHVARGKLLQAEGRLNDADKALAQGIELARRGDARFDLAYGLLTFAEVKGSLPTSTHPWWQHFCQSEAGSASLESDQGGVVVRKCGEGGRSKILGYVEAKVRGGNGSSGGCYQARSPRSTTRTPACPCDRSQAASSVAVRR